MRPAVGNEKFTEFLIPKTRSLFSAVKATIKLADLRCAVGRKYYIPVGLFDKNVLVYIRAGECVRDI